MLRSSGESGNIITGIDLVNSNGSFPKGPRRLAHNHRTSSVPLWLLLVLFGTFGAHLRTGGSLVGPSSPPSR